MTGAGLEGRAVLVTGGSRGIGRAVVLGALAGGADVAYCSRDGSADAELADTAARQSPGRKLLALRADVSREEEVEAFFDGALATLGRVDAVVSNAGVSREDLLVSCLAETWDALVAVNLTGAFFVARRAVREMAGRGGSLVFMGSLQQYGAPRGAAAYAATKGGLTGLMRAIAWEHHGEGIRANQVAAGYVETEMTRHLPEFARQRFVEVCPLKRLPTTEEVAGLILFLASARSAGINGETLHAAGGIREMFL